MSERAMSERAIVSALTLLAIAMVAGVVHIASLLAMPHVAPADAYARLAAAVPEGAVAILPRGASPAAVLPGRDPSLATAVCRYDLANGPLRVSAPVGDVAFLALTLHSRSGVAFYGLSDRASNEGRLELVVMTQDQLADAKARDAADAPARDVRVAAPQPLGFVLFDVLPRRGDDAAARKALSAMGCGR